MEKDQAVYETCLLLVKHFRNMGSHSQLRNKFSLGRAGFHTRIFSHTLHPEKDFVFAGVSEELKDNERHHLEHVVPCTVLLEECIRLINQ